MSKLKDYMGIILYVITFCSSIGGGYAYIETSLANSKTEDIRQNSEIKELKLNYKGLQKDFTNYKEIHAAKHVMENKELVQTLNKLVIKVELMAKDIQYIRGKK